MKDSESPRIVDSSGNRVEAPPTATESLRRFYRHGRRATLWIIAAITLLGGLIANGGRIIDAVRPGTAERAAAGVPGLAVTLRNSGDVQISLPVRGEYWLWPPGGGTQYLAGAYEFRQTDGSTVEPQVISVDAYGHVDLLIHVSNPAARAYLRTGDYHIDFMIRTTQGGRNIVWSGPIPFTERAMSSRYALEIFEKPDTVGR